MRNDYDAPEGESFDELYHSDGLRWMSIMVVVLVVFGFFSLGWYAWQTNDRHAEDDGGVMVVEADTSPYRERPENPGGMKFPHQDKRVYSDLVAGGAEGEANGQPQVESLLPEPEEPVVERNPNAVAEKNPTSWINKDIHPDAEASAPKAEESKEVAAAAQEEPKEASKEETEEEASKENVKEAKKEAVAAPTPVAEVPVAEEEKIPDYKPLQPVVKPWLPKEKQPEVAAEKPVEEPEKPEAPVVKPVAKEAPKAPKETLPKETMKTEDPIVAQAEKYAAAAPAKAPASAPAAAAGGSAEVQLAALRSRQEAEALWQKLSVKHGDVLGGMSHRVVAAEIPGKGTYYRLRVGVASSAAGSTLCSSLQSRNQACLLVR